MDVACSGTYRKAAPTTVGSCWFDRAWQRGGLVRTSRIHNAIMLLNLGIVITALLILLHKVKIGTENAAINSDVSVSLPLVNGCGRSTGTGYIHIQLQL